MLPPQTDLTLEQDFPFLSSTLLNLFPTFDYLRQCPKCVNLKLNFDWQIYYYMSTKKITRAFNLNK